MKYEVETNINMDNKDYIVLNCDTLGAVPEAHQKLQMSSLPLTKDNMECVDETVSQYNNSEDSSEHVQSSEYVNYYDSEVYVLEQLKTEFPEDVLPQSDCSVNSKIHSENKELLRLVAKAEVNDENAEDGLSLNIKKENDYNEYQFIVKTEGLEEQEDTQCKFYDKTLKNSCNLLQNSNKHVKEEINTPVDDGITEIHQYKYCGNGFDNYNNMLVHSSNDQKQEKSKCDICGKQFKSVGNLKRHILAVHKLDKPLESVTENSVNCHMNVQHKCLLNEHSKLSDSTKVDGEDVCKNKVTRNITTYDYKTTFQCRSGEQFTIHLREHNRSRHRHNAQNTNNGKFQCGSCKNVFKAKHNLTKHVENVHYDHEKWFDCWCGKQYRSPIQLREHQKLRHRPKILKTNDGRFQCDSCKNFYKTKYTLLTHVERVHYDYGKLFDCRCGKQFRSPMDLRKHERDVHENKVQNTNNSKFQCDYCKLYFKTKTTVLLHIKRLHYDYGKRFDCWCGKQFPSPIHLRDHKRQTHRHNVQNADHGIFQCDYCKKKFKNKRNLDKHIKGVHFDYGRKFTCWCGKQFRSPMHLTGHKRFVHRRNVQNTNNCKFQCDYCKSFFKAKTYLYLHIKRVHYDYGKRFDCWCGKQFNSPIQLRDHKRVIHREY